MIGVKLVVGHLGSISLEISNIYTHQMDDIG